MFYNNLLFVPLRKVYTSAVFKRWAAVISTCLTIFISNVNLTAVNLALPFISQDLNANLSIMPWVISSYVIASAMFMILGGRLGDFFGTKKIYVLSLFLWIVSLAMAGYASSITMLIIARVLQGIAFAISLPLSMVVITKVFPPERINLAVSINITVLGLSQVIGPTLAGVLLQYLNWHWIFLISIPTISLALLCAYLGINADEPSSNKQKLDYLGSSLLILGLLCLMLLFSVIQQRLISSLGVCLLSVAVIGIFIIFYAVEKKITNPIIDFDLLFEKTFFNVNLARILFQFLYFVLLYTLPLYLLHAMNMTAIQTGILLLYMTIPFAVFSAIVGRIANRISNALLIFYGFLAMTAAFTLLSFITQSFSMILLIAALFLAGIATAIVFSCSTAMALALAPKEKKGIASGLFFTNTLIGGAIGISISTILMQIFNQYYLALNQNSNLFSTALIEKNAFIFSFNYVLWMCISIAALGALLSFFKLKNIQKQ